MKKIAIVTGTRAEYGLFYPLLQRLKVSEEFELQLLVTGMHLSPEFGLTYQQIESDGFKVAAKVEMLLSSDTEIGIAKSIGLGVIGFADALKNVQPDLLVLLGDRFETYAAAIAGFIAKIPIAHLYGGELTEGLIDEAIRHSITKMSLLHFVATEEYRKRVIQLGENPGRVFNVGALGIDNIMQMKLLTREELEEQLNFRLGKKNVLVTFHPVTLEKSSAGLQFKELLYALNRFPDLHIIFTKPNADTNGRVIIQLIDEYVKENQERTISYTSLGQLRYLSSIQFVDAVIGNSSSGLIEVPSFGKPTINIGDRQRGRVQAASVLNSLPECVAITEAIQQAFSPNFNNLCKQVKNPYGDGNAAEKIIKILQHQLPEIKNNKKKFYDLEVLI